MRLLLNVGCGHQRPKNWINADCSLNSAAQRLPGVKSIIKALGRTEYASSNCVYMDVAKPWRFKASSLDAVYGSHIIEHLSISKSKYFLAESLRTLKCGGALRIVVPDLYQIAKIYIRDFGQGNNNAAREFLYQLNLHRENCYPPSNSKIYQMFSWLQDWPHQHKYMYDKQSLGVLLAKHGFHRLTFCSYGFSSYIPEIKELEATAEGVPSIYAECIKQ